MLCDIYIESHFSRITENAHICVIALFRFIETDLQIFNSKSHHCQDGNNAENERDLIDSIVSRNVIISTCQMYFPLQIGFAKDSIG